MVHIVVNIENRTNIAAKSAGADYILCAASVSTLGINAVTSSGS